MTTKAPSKIDVNVSEVVNLLRIQGKFAPALRETIERKVTAQAARDNGHNVTDEELQEAADTFRQIKGLQKAEDTQKWLESRGLDLDDLESYLEENLLIKKMKDEIQDQADEQELVQSESVQEHIREEAYGQWLSDELENGAS